MKSDPSKRIPTSADSGEQWVEWHKSLKKWFSKDEANEHWTRFWNQRGGAGSEADTHSLRTYMDTQGVNLTTTTMGNIADGTLGVVDFVGDTFTWARGLIIGGVILGMGLIAFYVIHSTRKGKTAGQMMQRVPAIGKGRKVGKMITGASTVNSAQSIAPVASAPLAIGDGESIKMLT